MFLICEAEAPKAPRCSLQAQELPLGAGLLSPLLPKLATAPHSPKVSSRGRWVVSTSGSLGGMRPGWGQAQRPRAHRLSLLILQDTSKRLERRRALVLEPRLRRCGFTFASDTLADPLVRLGQRALPASSS